MKRAEGSFESQASPDLQGALSSILDALDQSLRSGGYKGDPVRMYLAGGLAVNFYCGSRYTEDVDAFFSKRLILPATGLDVPYRRRDGKPGLLYLDRQYNPTLGLEHRDAEKDSIEWEGIGNERRLIQLRVLAPVDLAISKVSRLSQDDYADILALSNQGFFSPDEFKRRGEEALAMYAGNDTEIRLSILRLAAEMLPSKDDDEGSPGPGFR